MHDSGSDHHVEAPNGCNPVPGLSRDGKLDAGDLHVQFEEGGGL